MASSWKPRLRRAVALFLVGGAALGSVACGSARPFSSFGMIGVWGQSATLSMVVPGSDPGESAERFEAALLAQVNADRAAHGLRALALDPELVPAARARAAAQAPGAALSHAEPQGKEAGGLAFQRLLKEAGVRYSVAGENLARPRLTAKADAAQAAEVAQRALMASETHRQNILDPAFDRMAVGMTRAADGQLVFAQLFRAA